MIAINIDPKIMCVLNQINTYIGVKDHGHV
jgi:hypothetical protein